MANYVTLALISDTVMSPACAWNNYDHKLVANILERHLHSMTNNAIVCFHEGKSLKYTSIWPYKITSRKSWSHTQPRYTININDKRTFSGIIRNRSGDVLEALAIQYMRVADRSLTNRQQWQALAFFVHFSAEIHQPLYLYRRNDRGGNNLDVKSIDHRNNFNLHQIWGGLLVKNDRPIHKYAKKLDADSVEDTVN